MKSITKQLSLKPLLAGVLLVTGLTACGPSPTVPSSPSPSASAYYNQSASGGLAALLTGEVVSGEEQQLRDTLKRQIVLDFPIRVGVLFYGFNSKLDAADREVLFDNLRKDLKDTGMVSETIQIPSALAGSGVNISALRQMGARFQTDIVILVGGEHSFSRSRSQNIPFFESFSDKAYYESKMSVEAIALDVYTGTLLSPFDASAKSEPSLLDQRAADFSQQAYQLQKQVETEAWSTLKAEAIERLEELKSRVDELKANPPQPTPTPVSSPSPVPSAPAASPSPSPAASSTPQP